MMHSDQNKSTRRKTRHHSLALRMIWFSTAVITVAVLLSSIVAYQQSKSALKDSLAHELRSVVSSLAPFIDGDLHELIQVNEQGELEGRDSFNYIRKTLVKVRDRSGLTLQESSIYTLRKAPDFDRTGDLEFVVMTDRDENGDFIIGNRYPVQRHSLQALNGASAVSDLYKDSDGVWISASAPIQDSLGNVVGIVQADRHVDSFYTQARMNALPILLSAIFSVMIGSILSVFWTRALIRPVRQLVDANRQVGQGDLDTHLELGRRDEIGILGDSFNQMVDRLKALQTRERTMASFAELNPAPVLSFDQEGRIRIANPSSTRLFEREDLTESSITTLFAGLNKLDLGACIRGGDTVNYNARIGDRFFQFIIKGIPDLGIALMYGSDVSELKTAESETARARERAEVKARQLADSVKELQLFNQLSVDRELRMIELKRLINDLRSELGQPPAYDLSSVDTLPTGQGG